MDEWKLKICLLGDKAVGKTSTIRRFVYNVFDEKYQSTIGTTIDKKDIEVDDKKVTLMVWDILGEEGFDTLRSMYFKGAKGALFVADATNKESLDNIDKWLSAVYDTNGKIPVVILCNKWDKKYKEISWDEIKVIADRYSCEFLITSAKTGENVEEAFQILTSSML